MAIWGCRALKDHLVFACFCLFLLSFCCPFALLLRDSGYFASFCLLYSLFSGSDVGEAMDFDVKVHSLFSVLVLLLFGSGLSRLGSPRL